ncbi:MAG TPA: hypothetical protein VFE94_04290 [Candidatus Paceibacterota bacterium]|nr:hypothetical protein [Candidatus Paceibacterota bacterium]
MKNALRIVSLLLLGLVIGCVEAPVIAKTVTPVPELSAEFDRASVRPNSPVDVRLGEDVYLYIEFTNTGAERAEFCAAVTLRPVGEMTNRNDINLRPLIPTALDPGERGVAEWRYKTTDVGNFDLIFGLWGACAAELEPNHPVVHSGWFENYIRVSP